jgi:replicative DNA helicase
VTQEKLPPHDNEAEEAVIGSLLVDGEAIHEVATDLKPDDFFGERNKWIYEACLALYQRNEGINEITVARELAHDERLEKIGGGAYLSHLISIVPTPFHIKYYGGIVNRLALMRRLISAGGEITRIGFRADADVDASMAQAEDALFHIRERRPQDFVSLRDVLNQFFEEAGAARGEAHERSSIPTGFRALDDFLGGMQRSNLVVLAARTSAGKTSLALNIARNAAVNQRACVALFSLEMSRSEIADRFLSSESGVDSQSVRRGEYTEEQEATIMEASGVLSEAPIFIDDEPQLTVIEMRSKVRRLNFEHPVDLVIIDYLQLMQGETSHENRVQEISRITRALKGLARELNVPVLAISQLSRQVEWRASHVPQLSDLRESGSIEQDADVVLLVYRPELHITPEEWEKYHPDLEAEPYPKGIAEIEIAKHRNGPIGKVSLRFIGRCTRFADIAAEIEVA